MIPTRKVERDVAKDATNIPIGPKTTHDEGGAIQHKLDRVRKTRVYISYKLESGGAELQREVPFLIGIVGDFSGNAAAAEKPLTQQTFVEIDRDNFDDMMKQAEVSLLLRVPNRIVPESAEFEIRLTFGSLNDFEPNSVVNQVEALRILKQKQTILEDFLKRGSSESLQHIGNRLQSSEQHRSLLRELFLHGFPSDEFYADIVTEAITAARTVLRAQLHEILQHREFLRLEGSWRGLHYLVMNSETSDSLKLRMLNVTKAELFSDLNNATEFDQSEFFKKIYKDEFEGRYGRPYGAIIGDFEFTNHPDDIAMLQKISAVAAAAHCPFVSAASPGLFGMESWTELTKTTDIQQLFSGAQYNQWNSFRDTENSRYVTLVMPRTLARLPYAANTESIEPFAFVESRPDENGHAMPTAQNVDCWMNAAFALGTIMARSFAETGWCTAIRGRETGGTVENLPNGSFMNTDGELVSKCPTEIAITEHREKELSDQGILPLCHFRNSDYFVFCGAQTVHRAKAYQSPEATANAAITARLPYIMATSRIAHYLICICRDNVGSFETREYLEDWLRNWISDYVLADETASQEKRARYPFAEAGITVEEIPEARGSYNVVAMLKPRVPPEMLTTAMRMVVKLPSIASQK